MIRPLLWLSLLAVWALPVVAQEASPEKRAQKLHAISFGEQCHPSGGYVPDDPIESWTFRYAPSWSEGTEEDKEEGSQQEHEASGVGEGEGEDEAAVEPADETRATSSLTTGTSADAMPGKARVTTL